MFNYSKRILSKHIIKSQLCYKELSDLCTIMIFCTFISHNSDFIKYNFKFISHSFGGERNCGVYSHNSEGEKWTFWVFLTEWQVITQFCKKSKIIIIKIYTLM